MCRRPSRGTPTRISGSFRTSAAPPNAETEKYPLRTMRAGMPLCGPPGKDSRGASRPGKKVSTSKFSMREDNRAQECFVLSLGDTTVQDNPCANRCRIETTRHSRAGGNPDGFLVRFLRTLWMPAKGRVDSIQEPRKKHAFSSSRQTNAMCCLMSNPTRLRRATNAHKSGRHKSDALVSLGASPAQPGALPLRRVGMLS